MTEAEILKAALRYTAYFDASADATAFVNRVTDDLIAVIRRFVPGLSRFEIDLALAAFRARQAEALPGLVAELAHQTVTEAYDYAIQDAEIPAEREDHVAAAANIGARTHER
jgi:hypothetical protein